MQPDITFLATQGRILINLPGQTNPKRVRELLQGTANLEFWETYENNEIIGYLSAANNLLKEIQVNEKAQSAAADTKATSAKADTTKKDQSLLDLIDKDTTKNAAAASTREEFALQNPLFGYLNPRVDP